MSWAYQPGLRCSQRSSSYGARRPMLAPRCPAIGRVGPGLLRDPSPRSDELAVAIGAVSQHSDAAECQEAGLAGLSRQTEGWGSRFAKSLLLAALVAPTLVWGAAFPAAARAKHEPVSTATLAPSHITSNSAAAVRTIPQQAAHTAQAVQAFLAVPQNQAVAGVLAALMLGMAFARARAQEASTKVAATAAAEVAAPAAAAAVGATVHTPVAPTTPAIASSATPAATSHAATAPAAALTSAPVAHPASHFANFAAARAAAAAGTASPAAAAAAPSPPQVIAVSAMRAASAAPPAAAAPAPAAPATAAPDVMPAAAAAAPPFARSPSLSPEASPALALSDLNRASQLKGLRAQHTVMAAAVADAVEVSVPAVSVAETVAVSGGAEDTLIVSNVVAFNLARAVAGRKAAPLPYYASLAPPSPPTHPPRAAEVEALAVSPVPAEEDAVPVSETVRQNLALAAKLEILHQLQREGVITRSSPLPFYASLSPTPPPPPKQAPPPPQQAPVPAPTAVQQQQQQPPPGVVSSPAAETRGHVVGDAVQHWSDMVKSSPISALEAVSEARALADAVISEVDGVAPLAAATAAALASPKPPDGWMWAWLRAATASVTDPLRNLLRVGPPGPPSKYDMVRFGPWTAPTTKSKWDPLSNMAEWDAPKGPLPAWDPLARLRELAPKRGVDGVPLPRSKYDAIGQLVDFLQELPQLVNSAEWSKASAADPVRFLLADVARRPSSRLLAVSHKPWAPPAKRRSKWRKYDPLAGLLAAAAAQARWEDVVADMLQLEAVCGPQVPQFSPIKVMAARDGKAFAEALADFKKLAVSEPGAAQFAQQFPALRLWLQAASNVSLATCAGGVKLGPVWGLLQLPTYQDTLKTARDSLPAFMRHLQRKHYPLYSLLRQGDPHQILTLLAILAAWVVADEMDTTGKAPASLLPPPPLEAAVVPPPPEEVRGLFGGLRLPGFPAQALAGFGPFANAGKMFAPATTSRNAPPS